MNMESGNISTGFTPYLSMFLPNARKATIKMIPKTFQRGLSEASFFNAFLDLSTDFLILLTVGLVFHQLLT